MDSYIWFGLSMEVTPIISPWFLLSGIGMILTGVLFIIYWRLKSKASFWYFLLGGVVWGVAIGAKAFIDLTISGFLRDWLSTLYSTSMFIVVWGLFIGLRTGYLECGLAYLIGSKSRLKQAVFTDAVAFGIGFGATEAIVIGVSSLINITVLILIPELLNTLPPAQRSAVLQQFSLGVWLIPAPIIERFSTILVHIFTCVLIIYAVQTRCAEYFLAAFFFKSLIDGLIPWLNLNIGVSTLQGIYMIEGIVAIFGIVGFICTIFLGRAFLNVKNARPRLSIVKGVIAILAITVLLFTLTILCRIR